MGVHGLWKLIESAGKPVPVETLENKILAVDVSIWLHQLMKGYQTPSGASVSNAYLLGLFTRVCKLLFTNVKPVFVFDGGVPQLKKKTIAARQQQKNKSAQASEKLRQQLLKNLLKQKAVSQVLEEIRGQSSPKKKERDMFELPPLPEAEDSLSEVEEMSNSSSEDDVKPIKMKFKDLHTIDVKSAEFRDLPADMRHDILTELKETRKQNSWGRIHELPEDLGDFSKYQMSRLLKRRSVQVSLEEAEKEMGGRTLSLNDVEALLAEGGVEINPQLTKRIASDNVTRFIYVRGNNQTGEQPTSSQENKVEISSTEKENPSFNDNKIKEEIIDCDELSDSELLKRVEAIEMAYIASNIKKEENVEFGTEDIFEEDTSSEGVIIDDMDLIKDTSGLSQEQILAIIKKENQDKTSLSNENIPSTSKEGDTFQEYIFKAKNSEDLISSGNGGVVLPTKNIFNLSDTSNNYESKVLDSPYFKINKKILVSALSDKSKHIISDSEIVNLNTIAHDSKTNKNLENLVKPSEGSGIETSHNLPCEVSLLELPKSTSKVVLKQPHVADTSCSNKALVPTQSKNLDDATYLSSSESDGEFVEVPSSTCVPSSLSTKGLEIQIQTTQDKEIHDDIFADIFENVKANQTSVGNVEIKQNVKGFQIKPLSSKGESLNVTERKEIAQSLLLPSLKSKVNSEKVVNKKTSCTVIKKQNKLENTFKDLQTVKVAPQEKAKCVQNLPVQNLQEDTKNTQSSKAQKQFTTQTNKKCVLGSQIQKLPSLDDKKDARVIQTQPNTFQRNRKYRQSLYTKQVNQTNVQNSQINNQTTKKKTVDEIFSSLFDDDESDNETADNTEIQSVNDEHVENEECNNQIETEKNIYSELNFESESFESVKNMLEKTPSPTNHTSVFDEEEENEEFNSQIEMELEKIDSELSFESESFETVKNRSFETVKNRSFETVKNRLEKTLIPTNQASVFNEEEESIHEQDEESFMFDINPSILERNKANKEKLCSSVSSTQVSEDQSNIQHSLDDSEDVDDPGQINPSILERNKANKEKLCSSVSSTQVSEDQPNIQHSLDDSEDVDDPGQINPSILERNKANKEKLCSSVSSTQVSEDQSNIQHSLDDSEDVDDPGQIGENEDPLLSEDVDQGKKPKRILDLKQLEKLQDILETKERELVVDQNREDRLATSLTDQMYQEAQELLRLFGVPYVVAPMEAEAQCAFLDASGLTEGTITDDSDIWLFGGRKVYKNFFDQKKFVLEFQSGDIQQYFKLTRSHLVLLALLVGSDYTVGLSGVGPVTALEILSTFPLSRPDSRDSHELLVSLTRFREWWRAHPDTHTALAKKLRNVDVHEGFPSPAVVSAYLNPLVDDSREPFTWGTPDVAALRDFAERKFGWNRSRTDQVLLPAVNKLSQRTSQLTLHTFFGAIPNIPRHREQMSRRVQSAVNRLEGGSAEFTPVEPRPRQPRGRGGRGRGRAAAPPGLDEDPSLVSKLPEVIPQREKDRAEATKRKQQAIEVLKNKKQKGIKKRRNVRQMKPEANLSESSSDDN